MRKRRGEKSENDPLYYWSGRTPGVTETGSRFKGAVTCLNIAVVGALGIEAGRAKEKVDVPDLLGSRVHWHLTLLHRARLAVSPVSKIVFRQG